MNFQKHMVTGLLLVLCVMLAVPAVYGQELKPGLVDDMLPGMTEPLYKPAHTLDRGIIFNDIGAITGNSRTYGYWQSNYSPFMLHGYWGNLMRMFPIVTMPPGPWGQNIPTYLFGTVDRSNKYNSLSLVGAIIGTSLTSVNNSDWEAKDFNLDRAMGGSDGARGRNNIPLIAISDRDDSWPYGYYEEEETFSGSGVWNPTTDRRWPGRWARNPDAESDNYGQPVYGKFVSSRDSYYSEYDKYAGIRPEDDQNDSYPVGLDMETSTYAYSSFLNRDVLYWNVDLIFQREDWVRAPHGNTEMGDPGRHMYTGTIDSMYMGVLWYTRIPYADHPYNYAARPEHVDLYYYIDHAENTLFMYNKYGEASRQWGSPQIEGPVSVYSFYLADSPQDKGITSFHYFDYSQWDFQGSGQQIRVLLYAMFSGDPQLIRDLYASEADVTIIPVLFHPFPENGATPDYHFDSIDSQWLYQDFDIIYHNPDLTSWERGPNPHLNRLDATSNSQVANRPYNSSIAGSGPFSMSPGDTVHFSFAMFGGADSPGPRAPGSADDRQFDAGDRWPLNDPGRFGVDPHDRFGLVYNKLQVAKDLFTAFFQGSGAPSTPTLWAKGTLVIDDNDYPGYLGIEDDVRLYWNDIADNSQDVGTKEFDFEGYRLYKRPINTHGGSDWELIEQWDLINDITGWDTLGVSQFFRENANTQVSDLPEELWLGNDNGVVHNFLDNDVTNGVWYEYALTAYDRPDLVNLIPSSSSPRGVDSNSRNIVRVRPVHNALGYVQGDVDVSEDTPDNPPESGRTQFNHTSGIATGSTQYRVVDELLVKDTQYTVTFSDFLQITGSDTVQTFGYSVHDDNADMFVLENVDKIWDSEEISSGNQTSDYFPFFDGIGLNIIDYSSVDDEQYLKGWTNATLERRLADNDPYAEGEDNQWDFGDLNDVNPRPGIYEFRFIGDKADSAYRSGGGVNAKVSGTYFPFQIWDITDKVWNDRKKTPGTGTEEQMLLKLQSTSMYGNPFPSGARVYIADPDNPGTSLWYFTVNFPTKWELDESAWHAADTLENGTPDFDAYPIYNRAWQNTFEGPFALAGDIATVKLGISTDVTTEVPPAHYEDLITKDSSQVIGMDIDTSQTPPDTSYIYQTIDSVRILVPYDLVTLSFDTIYWTQDSLDKLNPATTDRLIWKTEFPFTEEDVFTFASKKSNFNDITPDMWRIAAVPNPYVVSAPNELYVGSSSWNRREVRFINLPQECTIDIYTISGDLVRHLEHKNNTGGYNLGRTVSVDDHVSRYPTGVGEERWDLLTSENLDVSYGMYIYVVKTPDGKKFIDKLVLIK